MGIEPSVFGRRKRERGARPPEGTNDPDQTPNYKADPRELVGPEGVTMVEAPEAAEERGAEEP